MPASSTPTASTCTNAGPKTTPATKPTTTATSADELIQEQKGQIAKASGIPPKPAGQKRQQLLDALRKAAPDVVRYEDKAIDAARNQCRAINRGGQKLGWLTSHREQMPAGRA